ncbi:MAG TPA: hypothetical protein VGE70_01035 [Burkholderiaceae bacterium]
MATVAQPVYSRPLSGIERYSLMFHAVCRYHVDAILQGQGDLSAAELRMAVATAAEANPGVRVRLRGILGWARWVDSGIAPVVHVVESSNWTGSSGEGADFLSTALDAIRGGPVADLFLVRCADQQLRIVFRSVHAAIDGRGIMHWIQDIFRVLRGDPPIGSHSTLTDGDVQARYRDRLQHSGFTPLPPADTIPVISAGTATGPLDYIWRRVVLPKSPSGLLARSAVFLAQWARQSGPGEVRFTIPVDYRGLRTDEMGVGNLTGFLKLCVEPTDTHRSLTLRLSQLVKAYADCYQSREIPVIRWLPLRFLVSKLRERLNTLLFKLNHDMPSGGIVSMGSPDMARYSCAGFRAEYLYGIPGFVGKLNVVFLSYADFAVVTFAAPAAYNDQKQFDALIHAYEAHFSS